MGPRAVARIGYDGWISQIGNYERSILTLIIILLLYICIIICIFSPISKAVICLFVNTAALIICYYYLLSQLRWPLSFLSPSDCLGHARMRYVCIFVTFIFFIYLLPFLQCFLFFCPPPSMYSRSCRM